MRAPAAILAAAATIAAGPVQRPELAVREVFLMGTRVRVEVESDSRRIALATIETGIRALEAAERQLSTWIPESAISQINAAPIGRAWQGEPAVCALLGEVFAWTRTTGRAFDPTIGALTDAWNIHGDGRVPSAAQLESARVRTGVHLFDLDERRCSIVRRGDVTIDVGAFGKGEALDRAAAAMPATAWLIDLGGQVAVGGPRADGSPWVVSLAHPEQRAVPHLQVRLRRGSLSTSGGSERDLRVDGTRVGHIVDPSSGRPATFTGSVSVWHERGLTADILSTALYVMGPDVGWRWAEDRGIAAAFLVSEAGGVRLSATERFRPLIAPE